MTEAHADEITYCSVHPDRETGLRCNRCGRYMCAQCAVSTPVGYRCRECVRQVEDKFFTGTNTDYLIAFGVGAVVSAIAAFILGRTGLGSVILLLFFIAVPAGGALGQLIFRAVGRRRGRYTAQIAAAGVIVGVAAVALLTRSYASIGLWIFAGIMAALVYGRFQLK
jgi:hypothetical protein